MHRTLHSACLHWTRLLKISKRFAKLRGFFNPQFFKTLNAGGLPKSDRDPKKNVEVHMTRGNSDANCVSHECALFYLHSRNTNSTFQKRPSIGARTRQFSFRLPIARVVRD